VILPEYSHLEIVPYEEERQIWDTIVKINMDIIPYKKKSELTRGGLRWPASLGQDRGNIKIGFRYPQGVWC